MCELYEQLKNLAEVVQYLSNKTGHHIAIYGDPGKMEDMAQQDLLVQILRINSIKMD